MSLANGPDFIEGTWEEIASQSAKFTGQRVRVSIVALAHVPVLIERAPATPSRGRSIPPAESPVFDRERIPIYD
jgi:uncharacterized membrane protein